MLIAQAIPAQRLELINEQPSLRRRSRQVLSLAFQHQQAQIDAEAIVLLFGLLHDERLEGREIVRQQAKAARQQPGVLDLRGQELHRHRQMRRRQDLLVNLAQDLLGRHFLLDPLPQGAKEVRLLDVFLAVQKLSHVAILLFMCRRYKRPACTCSITRLRYKRAACTHDTAIVPVCWAIVGFIGIICRHAPWHIW